jgi:L-seryl-tRNA(Ser) seleniumtransferase
MATATASTIFEQLGITPVINARGNQTLLGGSTPSARVRRAMQDTERYYVDMKQLLERSGQIIAGLLECEAAYVTPGAAAAMALGTAACIAGDDLDKIGRLPDTTGMKNIVVIQSGHHYHYQRAINVPGGRVQEVDSSQFEASLGPNVAAVLFPAHLDGAPGTLRFTEVIEIAHRHGVPVLVDAAGRIYPLDKFKSYTAAGADLVAFGAKYIGALNSSGILAGRKDLVAAASMQGFIGFETTAWEKSFGRPLKLDRQTIVAVVVALQEWFETDHEARIAGFERRLEAIQSELQGAAGVQQSLLRGEGSSPLLLRLDIDGSKARADAPTVIATLEAGTPAIVVGRDGENAILVNPVTLREEDDGIVASRLGNLLL